jgi:hypothetical protein
MSAFLSKDATYFWLHASEWTLLIFGIILTLGLIGEYRKKWEDHIKTFEILVIIGVAGELFGDGGIFIFSERLQTISDHEVAGVNKQAGEANRKAGESNKEAGAARRVASTADERTKKLEISNKQLGIDLTKAKSALQQEIQKTAKVQKEATEAEHKLTLSVASRTVDKMVKDEDLENLKSLPPAEAAIEYRDEDPSIEYFAFDLLNSLRSEGWSVPKEPMRISPTRFGVGREFPSGTVIYSHPQGTRVPFESLAKLPFSVRMTAGIMAVPDKPSEIDVKLAILMMAIDARSGRYDPSLPVNVFRIVIGPRTHSVFE